MAYTISLFQPTVTRRKNGEKVKAKSKVWWFAWRDAQGRLQRESTGTKNRRVADQAAALKQLEFDRGNLGLTDPYAEHRNRPIAEHYADYKKVVRSREGTEDHKTDTINRVDKIIKGCGWKKIGDIKKGSFESWLGEQKTKTGQLISRETRNRYVWALKNFVDYLLENGRLESDPLPGLKKTKKKAKDRRYRRIPLTWEQAEKLLKHVAESTVTRRGLTPMDRSVLYRLALMTGYRRGSLRELRVRDFRLASDPFMVILPATAAKNGDESGPTGLGAELAGILRRYIALQELGPEDRLFARLTDRTAEVVQRDLEAAGLPTGDEQGRVVDFHSFRYTYNHLLGERGVDLATRQKLMHHSTPDLTANTYAPVVDAKLLEAARALPEVPAISDSLLPPV